MRTIDKTIIYLLLVGAIWLLLAPPKPAIKELSFKQVTDRYTRNDHYISTDDLAKAIMSKDPSILIVDVRDSKQYSKFSLPGALNIPLSELLKESNRDLLDQDIYRIVFYSNGSSLADKAWLMCSTLGYENLYVLKGGLNGWFETIINPPLPGPMAGSEDYDLYEFRKGASMFFGGGSAQPGQVSSAPKPAIKVKRKKKQEGGGGCE